MAENKLCMGCMEYKGPARVCPKCGYVENTPHDPAFIAPGTMLHERYLVGRLISSNGQGATYIAYDTAVSCRVLLNEYLPEGLCVRVKGKPTISVNYNNLAQYKALMAEYTELNKSLAKMRSLSSHLSPTLDLFAENNTTYAVYEYIEGIKLVDYLKENAGELSWSEVSAMFPPLFTTLSLVHNAGVIHRGISPETIYVTDKGELKLTEFAISGLRTENTELNTEIFMGYAAPEQYSAASRQGTMTDVYGICAVLYRILTGSKPDPANYRLENDNLYSARELNPNIPKHVSDVIMGGMKLSGEERIQTITELVTRLFDQPTAGLNKTQTLQISREGIMETSQTYMQDNAYPPDDGYYNDNGGRGNYNGYDDYDDSGEIIGSSNEQTAFDKVKVPIIIGILLVAIIIVIIVVLSQLFSGNNESSNIRENAGSVSESTTETETQAPETTEEEKMESKTTEKKNKMPSLVGKRFEDEKKKFDEMGVTLNATYEDNKDYPKGVIFEQDVKIGQNIEKGMTVNVKVSEGYATAEVPDIGNDTGNYLLEDYKAMCDAVGIKYETVGKKTADAVEGIVLEVSVSPHSVINTEEETLVIYYSEKLEETTAATEATEESSHDESSQQQGNEEQQSPQEDPNNAQAQPQQEQ